MGINKVSGFKNTLPTRKLSEGLNSNKNREEIIGRRNDAYSLLSSVAQPLLNLGSLLQFSLLLACLFSFMSTVSGDGSGDYQAIVNPTKCGFPDPESVFNGTQPCYDMHTANFSSTNASLTCADWGIVIPCVRNYNISYCLFVFMKLLLLKMITTMLQKLIYLIIMKIVFLMDFQI